MDVRETRPSVPKQASRKTDEASGDTQWKTGFRYRNSRVGFVAFSGAEVVGVLWETSCKPYCLAYPEGDLNEAACGVAESVVGMVDLGDTLRHDKDEAEAESCPESEEEDDWFCEEEVGGAADGVVDEV